MTAVTPASAQDQTELPPPPLFAAAGPAPTPITPTPPPSCICGDRHGLRRLYWHRTHCKRSQQAHWLGYPEEFNEWQLGRSLYNNETAQVNNAEAARMIFYDYDFVDGTGQLNYRGLEKLASIEKALPTNFFAIGIEPTLYAPGLDQTRRRVILAQLAAGPFPVPSQRVVIATPLARGRGGVEAFILERNRIGTAVMGGAPGGTSSGTGVGNGTLDGSGLTGSSVSQGVTR